TGSFTRATAGRRACSRCPTAICTPGSGFSRKSTGTSRPEAFHGEVAPHWSGNASRARDLSRPGMLRSGERGYKAAPVWRGAGMAPAPRAQVASENTGPQVTAVQRAVIAGKRGTDAGSRAGFWALTLGTIGVVYGDIGTSPLYAMRESVVAAVGA